MFSEAEIVELVERYKPKARALLMVGSHARGTASKYSDLDLWLLPNKKYDHRLKFKIDRFNNSLVTLTIKTEREIEKGFQDPETSILQIPALRSSRVLYDPENILPQWIFLAKQFSFDSIQQKTHSYCLKALGEYAEEVNKIANALDRNDSASAVQYSIVLLMGLAKLLVLWHGQFLESENELFNQARNAAGMKSTWVHELDKLGWFDSGYSGQVHLEQQALIALHLYTETCRTFQDGIGDNQSPVIELALQVIHNVMIKIG